MQLSRPLIVAVVTSGILAYSLPLVLHPTYPNIDAVTQYRWTYEYALDLQAGFVFPHWAPLEYGGLGGPVYVYYPRVFYCIVLPFVFAIRDLALALRTAMALVGVALVLVIALTQKSTLGPAAWILGLLALIAPPDYMVQEWIHAYPWYLSAIPLYLFVRASLLQLESKQGFRPSVSIWLAVLYACHPLSAFMALITVPCPWAVRLIANRYDVRLWRSFAGWVGGTAMGLLLAGFYLIPSLGLLSLIRPAGWINAGHVGWQNTFVLQVVGHPWSKVFYIFGIWCYLLAIVVAVNLWSHRKSNRERDRIALDWFLVGAAGLFFACQLSYPLWCLDTPLQMLQRPFRFLPIATISMLISAAYCLTPISRAGRTTRTAIAGLILLAAATYAVFQFHIHYHKPDEQVAPEALQGEFGVAEYIPAVAGPHWETYVQSGGFAGQCRRLGLRCSSSLNGGAFHWTVEGAKPVTVLLPLFAYPAWHVTVNPRSAVYVDAETGLFAANLPAGLSNVEARWVLLPAERRGVYISLATGLILIFIMVLRGSCSRASPKCRSAVESGK